MILVSGLAMLIMVSGSAPVHAVERLLLSRDGVHWSSDLAGQAFDPDRRWVPGDERSTVLWAKNHSGEQASLTIDLVDVNGTSMLGGDFVDLEVTIGDRPAEIVDLGHIVSVPRTQAEEEIKIIITATLAESAANDTQGERLSFDLVAELRQVPDGSPSPPPTDDGLPGTGAQQGLAILTLIGLGGLVAGAASIRTGRRKDSAHDDSQTA